MNIYKSHECYHITDTFNNKEVEGDGIYTEHNNWSITLTIKDEVSGNTTVQAYITDVPGNDMSLTISYPGNFDIQLSKYIIDVISNIKSILV